MRKLSFEQATARYVHRYTCEYVPAWALRAAPNGKFYAPQYRSDREWYNNTKFHGEHPCVGRKHCFTTGQTWPHGHWLDSPFQSSRGA